MAARSSELTWQWLRAKQRGWVDYFKAAATPEIPAEVLMGIASRETNMWNIVGDGGHGHGLMQIDNRSYPEWCADGKWKNVDEGIKMGAKVLAEKMQAARHGLVPEKDVLRVAIEAYNDGQGNAVKDYFRHEWDARTTGSDYSRDVLKRSLFFKGKLAQ